MDLKSLEQLKDLALKKPKRRIVVTAAEDISVLKAVFYAVRMGLIEPCLIGDPAGIIKISDAIGLKKGTYEVIDVRDPAESCKKAVLMVKEGRADIIMKGLVPTSVFMKAILDKENGLETKGLLSHFALIQTSYYKKLFGITDVAININPSIEDKVKILNNAVNIFHRLGKPLPKVAVIAPVEIENPKILSTIEAAVLTSMNRDGNIQDCLVEGPLSLDMAVSGEAAAHKGIRSNVAGDADILVVPDLDAGNVLYKSLIFLSDGIAAAIVAGAQVPIVLTSRADSDKNKLFSIALAAATD